MKRRIVSLAILLMVLCGCSSRMKVHNLGFVSEGTLNRAVLDKGKAEIYNVNIEDKTEITVTYTNDLNTVYVMMAEAGTNEDAVFSRVDGLPCASFYDEDKAFHMVIYRDFGNEKYELYRFDFDKSFPEEKIEKFVTRIKYYG